MSSHIDKEELIKEINILIKNNKNDHHIYDDYDYGYNRGIDVAYSNIVDILKGE